MARKSNGKLWAEFVRSGGTAKNRASTPERVDRRPMDGIILGVDPSLRGTGIAVIETKGRQATLLHSEVFRFPPSYKTEGCIGEISRRLDKILQDFPIKVAAVEEAIYVQNYRTALVLGAARGSAIAAMVLRGVEINEYPPLRIKQAVVGYGRASKEQLRSTLVQMVAGATEKISLDESDATAVAMCHWFTTKRPHITS
ncbi:crossover junction endodeoxyribonuclease RuvC [Puniceicoccus vermicola]|uniref:crossover junction endodeoxyribonuclease n=1 Tax=Puniceicoccus vermicola TaxID=388746 RepID=A0A7X1E4C4_9BACT|nr:crossover junction endodeoxyribonuclease RuvC [Puniceicoccus vermicola]